MDPISSVSSLQHRLAVFLPLFFLWFSFFAHFSQPDFCFPLFCFSIFNLWFCFSTCTFPADTFCFSFPCKKLTQSKHGVPLPCIKKDGRLPQIQHSSHCLLTSGICVSKWNYDCPPHFSLVRGQIPQKAALYSVTRTALTGHLYRKTQSHDFRLPCAEQTRSSRPLSFNGKTNSNIKEASEEFPGKQELLRQVILLRLRRLSVCLKHFVLPRSRVLISLCFEEREKILPQERD